MKQYYTEIQSYHYVWFDSVSLVGSAILLSAVIYAYIDYIDNLEIEMLCITLIIAFIFEVVLMILALYVKKIPEYMRLATNQT